jgi:hypothetical protein
MTGNPELTRVMGPNLLCHLRGSPHTRGANRAPRIELAGDTVDAWKLVSPIVSEEIL